jgi:pimeloyl-ACP methyl ester carboxylesterase
MASTIVFVPGIMGSELQRPNGEIVWPPKVSETILGYHRIAELQDPAARATRIIANVSCVDFYAPIQRLFQAMGYGATGDRRLVEHPYDWRRDLFDLAGGLADRLDGVPGDEITIVAHSMGGLISRLLLETDTWRTRPWFPKIRGFVALATPHNGAPLALARVLGLDSAVGISAADFRTLSANPAYPSGYQLLPAPGEAACWNTAKGSNLAPLDFYDPAVATKLGLVPALVARTRALHDALRAGAPPPGVRYFYFAGAGHKTVTRINITGANRDVVATPDAGDGTVPLWSALPRATQKQVVINEHADVFRGTPFRRVFFRLFGQDDGAPLEFGEGEAGAVRLSLQRQVFAEGAPLDLVLTADSPITALDGRLVIDRITDAGDEDMPEVASHTLRYLGPALPALALTLPSSLKPGFHDIRFEGDRMQEGRAVFAVTRSDS